MEKKKSFFIGKKKDVMEKRKKKILQSKKMKQMKKKRIIIRNLSFKISEDELKRIFSEFGEILDIKMPLKEDGKKRGFAFVQYKDTKSQIKAMKEMNFKEIHGRPIAIDFAVDKGTYQSRQNSEGLLERNNEYTENSEDSEDECKTEESKQEEEAPEIGSQINCDSTEVNQNPQDFKVNAFLKEFDADDHDQDNSESESSDEISDGVGCQSESSYSDEEENINDDSRSKQIKKNHMEDIAEGKTVFIRNISFNNTEEDLQEVVQEFGDIEYCLFCMDSFTGQFKGSAFVKFKEKESANKFIQESSKEPGILLENRTLVCSFALSREELSKQNSTCKPKDKRNLNLLKYGSVAHGSKEAEGVSKADLAKRMQLEMVKKQKLRNVNFFVSDKRLLIHNLPKNINDKDLYAIFKKAADKRAIIKEARVMHDFKKTDAQGVPVSRGFGFVSFTEHAHALNSLLELNNNPKIFSSNMRPIVEFSIENKVALMSQERRREKLKMRRKKKKMNDHQQPTTKDTKAKHTYSRKMKQNKRRINSSLDDAKEKTTSNKKQKQHLKAKSKKEAVMNAQERDNLSVLTKKYKKKLLYKFS